MNGEKPGEYVPVIITKGERAGEELVIDARLPLSQLSPTALVTMPLVASLEQRIVDLENRMRYLEDVQRATR